MIKTTNLAASRLHEILRIKIRYLSRFWGRALAVSPQFWRAISWTSGNTDMMCSKYMLLCENKNWNQLWLVPWRHVYIFHTRFIFGRHKYYTCTLHPFSTLKTEMVQQAISISTNDDGDLCRHTISLGHNESQLVAFVMPHGVTELDQHCFRPGNGL